MKIVFMGTPEFALASLARLYEAGHEIVGVYTQPDKPKNRGMKMILSPVKTFALAHDIPVFQPVSLKKTEAETAEQLRALAPDLIVVAAYGKILPDAVLQAAPLGCINVHASLLPKYRGAAPINWAVLNGERETGVTIMHVAPELDAGDMILAGSTEIGENETAAELYDRLKVLGAELLLEAVEQIQAGTAPRTPQDHAASTYAPMLSKELSPVDWNRPAGEIHNQVRGLQPWPTACGEIQGTTFKIHRTCVSEEQEEGKRPGAVLRADKNGIAVVCGGGTVLCIRELQVQGGKRMQASAYLLGHPMEPDV
ncbi:MAG: methionyl-tRNA formyltransferase [Oscillospiraceae bacterium]|nr:methionyl-tRNA formyltransferase [Oscillospiraceae bacterium]